MKLAYEQYEEIAWGTDWEPVGPKLNVGKHRWYDRWEQAYKHNRSVGVEPSH